jgi:hypothetical protein
MDDISKDNKIYIIQKYLSKNDNKYYTILSNVIESYNLEHSTNINGVFLNLTMLDEEVLNDIYFRFTNSKNIVNEQIHKEIKQTKLDTKKKIKYEKDKLNLDKFDKFLIQQSRSNISI